MPEPHVVLVGHCGFDSGSLKEAAERALPDVPVVRVNSDSELAAYRSPEHLLLVNRKLDGDFVAQDGPHLIGDVTGAENPPKALLISDLQDAQSDAESRGGATGFGKRDVHSDKATDRIKAAWPGS